MCGARKRRKTGITAWADDERLASNNRLPDASTPLAVAASQRAPQHTPGKAHR